MLVPDATQAQSITGNIVVDTAVHAAAAERVSVENTPPSSESPSSKSSGSSGRRQEMANFIMKENCSFSAKLVLTLVTISGVALFAINFNRNNAYTPNEMASGSFGIVVVASGLYLFYKLHTAESAVPNSVAVADGVVLDSFEKIREKMTALQIECAKLRQTLVSKVENKHEFAVTVQEGLVELRKLHDFKERMMTAISNEFDFLKAFNDQHSTNVVQPRKSLSNTKVTPEKPRGAEIDPIEAEEGEFQKIIKKFQDEAQKLMLAFAKIKEGQRTPTKWFLRTPATHTHEAPSAALTSKWGVGKHLQVLTEKSVEENDQHSIATPMALSQASTPQATPTSHTTIHKGSIEVAINIRGPNQDGV